MKEQKKLNPFTFMLFFFLGSVILCMIMLLSMATIENNQNEKEIAVLEKQPALKVEAIREESETAFVCNAVHYLKTYHFKIAGRWVRTSKYTNDHDLKEVAEIEQGNYVRYTTTTDGNIIRIKKVR